MLPSAGRAIPALAKAARKEEVAVVGSFG